MARQSKTRFLILGLLAKQNLTGYDIKKRVEKKLSSFWIESYGQIYPELQKLTKEGLVTLRTQIRGERVVTKEYSITKKGYEAFMKWLKSPSETTVLKMEILIKLFFGKHITKHENILQIQQFLKRNLEIADNIKKVKAKIDSLDEESDDKLYYYLSALLAEFSYDAYTRWAEKAIQILEKS